MHAVSFELIDSLLPPVDELLLFVLDKYLIFESGVSSTRRMFICST
jgi:hypothetical protein